MQPIRWDERSLQQYYRVSTIAYVFLSGTLFVDLSIRNLFYHQHHLVDLWLIAGFFYFYHAFQVFRINSSVRNRLLRVFQIILGVFIVLVILEAIVGIVFLLSVGIGEHMSMPVRIAIAVPGAGVFALVVWGLIRLLQSIDRAIAENERRERGEVEPADIVYSDEPVEGVLDPGKAE